MRNGKDKAMEDNETLLKFWAYRHIDGHIHVKRFTSQDAIDDAYDSPFVDTVLDPFDSASRADAEALAIKRLSLTDVERQR